MFRLKVSHLQAYTTIMLPDALPTVGSHSVIITLLRCRLYWIDRTVTALFYLLIMWVFFCWSGHIITFGQLIIHSTSQTFRMMPILRALPEMMESGTGTVSWTQSWALSLTDLHQNISIGRHSRLY